MKSRPDYQRALEVAVRVADEARRLLLAECALPGGPRGTHGHCPADDEAEYVIRAELIRAFPEWGYRGEETGYQAPAAGETHIWLVDPNDGTSDMQRGYRGHAVSIGLIRDGLPVLGVVQAVDAPDDEGDLFAWAEGCGPLLRNGRPVEREPWPTSLQTGDVVLVSGTADDKPDNNVACAAPARFRAVSSIAYRLALAAAGEGAVAVALSGPCSWDYGGGHALLRGVGGSLVDENGAPIHYGPDGASNTTWLFGGAPEVVSEVGRRREWWSVFRGGFGDARPPRGFVTARLRPGALVHNSEVLRRAQGCLLGQVAGDALGAPVEFKTRDQVAAAYPDGGPRLLADGGPHRILAGQPTDDSELALILSRTLARKGSYDQEAVATGYAGWFHGWAHGLEACDHTWCRPFDVGGTTAKALGGVTIEHVRLGTAAASAGAAASRTSQANGALMRISPLGIWGWRRDPAEVAAAARADARLTHPHPICQDASAVFSVAIAEAVRSGGKPEQVYRTGLSWARANHAEVSVLVALERAATAPPSDYQTNQGWVLVALQNAFYRLLHEPTLEAAVVATVREGGDSDTNAAICGALAGAVHGREAIPAQWQRMVLSCRAMPGYAHIKRPRPATYWPADALTLAERLLG